VKLVKHNAKEVLSVAALLVVVLGSLSFSASAFAAEQPPQFQPELNDELVVSTRAHIVAGVETDASGAAEFKWTAEYALAEGGHEPAKNSPFWITDGGGTYVAHSLSNVENIALGELGEGDQSAQAVVHHLAPETTYYARFRVENVESHLSGEKTFEFRTAAIRKPEVARLGGLADTVEECAEGGVRSGGECAPQFNIVSSSATPSSAAFTAQIESNGSETQYSFEYSLTPKEPASWKPFTSGGAGTITVAEDFATSEAALSGLEPEKTYYVRIKMKNGKGEAEQDKYAVGDNEFESFTTGSEKPVLGGSGAVAVSRDDVTGTSAYLSEGLLAHGLETEWRFELAPSASGPWTPVGTPGAAGVISQAEVDAHPYNEEFLLGARIGGLDPATAYYVRLYAKNGAGEGEVCHEEFGAHGAQGQVCVPLSATTELVTSFRTAGPPVVTTFATHALDGESLRMLGAVDPGSVPTSAEQSITIGGAVTGGTFTLTFDNQTTAEIPYNADLSTVEHALGSLPNKPVINIEGDPGGPYTAYFGNDGNPLAEKAQPLIEADPSGLLPSGSTVSVVSTQAGGVAYDAHYHFQYVSQKAFAENGWAGAHETPSVDAGSGEKSVFAGADLAGLVAGEAYRYRLVGSNNSPGNAVVDGAEQSLTVPAAAVEAAVACPDPALRGGASANLPDCRGYEQVTPVDKEGAQELFTYSAVESGVLAGEDGDHLMVDAGAVNWGAGPGAGGSPYFFAHAGDGSWQLTAAAAQPETGVNVTQPLLYNSDLTEFAFESSSNTSTSPAGKSKTIQFEVGPPGGPYATVADIPRAAGSGDATKNNGWVAASQDFSKLILQFPDHTLLSKKSTGTVSGDDIYEYSKGSLAQTNVGVGSCGATVAVGLGEQHGPGSSAHSVSVEGSRVFFNAIPGSDCSGESHLYMRVNGERTVDIGAYTFLAANRPGTVLLLGKQSGEEHEVLLYNTESQTAKPLFSTHEISTYEGLSVSEDFSTIYFDSSEQLAPEAPPSQQVAGFSPGSDLYRYDLSSGKLSFIAQAVEPTAPLHMTPDGRYMYFESHLVSGVPGGTGQSEQAIQVYRYDALESGIECMSCASSFDPAPKLISFFYGGTGIEETPNSGAGGSPISANGDYAFFQTPAALVSSDVDGEVPPEGRAGEENVSGDVSLSSDVYEWRAAGVDGCVRVQGCLALITNGRGGHLNVLLGSADEGRDVFFYTYSQLTSSDNDTAGDIYDARIGGGTPPPALRPVECEGDACATPLAPPPAVTPSSSTFHGAGNPPGSPVVSTKPRVKPKKAKIKKKKGRRKQRPAKHGNARKTRSAK
jgi:hypothetical protein